MVKNGKNLGTGNSRNINVKCFLVKYKIYKGEVRVKYFPTCFMLADYFIKPLIRKMFQKLRDVVMGYK